MSPGARGFRPWRGKKCRVCALAAFAPFLSGVSAASAALSLGVVGLPWLLDGKRRGRSLSDGALRRRATPPRSSTREVRPATRPTTLPDGQTIKPPPPPPPPPGDAFVPPNCNPTPTRGATVAYQEYEAEAAVTNGSVLGCEPRSRRRQRLQQHRRRVLGPSGGEAERRGAERSLHDHLRLEIDRRAVRHSGFGGRERHYRDIGPLREWDARTEPRAHVPVHLGIRQPGDDGRDDQHPERRLCASFLRRDPPPARVGPPPPTRRSRSSKTPRTRRRTT